MALAEFDSDQPRDRTLNIDNKEFTLSCTQPYGLWVIKFPKGDKTPKELKGSYTSPYEATKALNAHLRTPIAS